MKYLIESLKITDYNVLQKFDTIDQTLDWLDLLLDSTLNFNFRGELNDLQADFKSSGLPIVPDKNKFPLRIYNYILAKYGLKIVERKE